ncbi:XRN 5'-3' exonuclease N-terminus family protein [Trichomonas vaginalis G3]|uniref:5'-3' exoribonuclease n=1 Tax=Trichomonas vaginalis (strain ATCC PRA-98 / G3) TaxID=412133 RepID=A2DLG3_TRIV3|nr:5'->3' exoribonuclease family [Trichomonas vaginalis G3]EAY18781.1 XRN 5'-3' exonuclease N-terminus family protein [Trichomonas vaginalis G3]KAI5539283.1 5'->3' exoribonuclease family [Trichomonas vaginalis G3]|eukprot:XP_001579767.1 XRN 5'-3' exonuclease N-terminus family protein [Trichomonas vaginalis G3]
MGVPSFFRWLQRKYPLVVSRVLESDVDVDPLESNPNTIGSQEFDNLYIDMNGLIHSCFHPADREQPKNIEEVYENIKLYLKRIFNIVRPRKLLYLAIDGVAPRAKMNQQRSRRFRAAKDSEYNRNKNFQELITLGKQKEAEKIMKEQYIQDHDSNIITPGTKFMCDLSQILRSFISEMQNTSPAWSNIAIILSDASVPGEGEHKIMEFIRIQRLTDGYNPNTRHVMYGLDADLIFLALASHEVYFSILRENIFDKKENDKPIGPSSFIFANIFVLRQYLDRELQIDVKFGWDLERVIDDIVFLCFAAGNDFLPQIPGFEIPRGFVDQLFERYKKLLPQLSSYITNTGDVEMKNLLPFMLGFDYLEPESVHNIVSPSERSISVSEYVNNLCNDVKTEYKPENDKKLVTAKFQKNQNNLEIYDTKRDKKFYYQSKFGFEDEENIKNVVHEYCKGMEWVLKYYTKGVASWSWFYPYHSAPLVSDFVLLDCDVKNEFVLGHPFTPLQQLMAVLPPQSSWCLPKMMCDLMNSDDSPILDFYPKKFKVDLEGGTTAWKGHVLIPFIDAHKLKKCLRNVNDSLNEEEKQRNSFGVTFLYNKLQKVTILGTITEYSEGYENECIYELPPYDSNDPRINQILEGAEIPLINLDSQKIIEGKRVKTLKQMFNQTKKEENLLVVPGIPFDQPEDFRIREMQKTNSVSHKKSSKQGKSIFNF